MNTGESRDELRNGLPPFADPSGLTYRGHLFRSVLADLLHHLTGRCRCVVNSAAGVEIPVERELCQGFRVNCWCGNRFEDIGWCSVALNELRQIPDERARAGAPELRRLVAGDELRQLVELGIHDVGDKP